MHVRRALDESDIKTLRPGISDPVGTLRVFAIPL
jgi:hypothetical protein